jgi:hypothetical protein
VRASGAGSGVRIGDHANRSIQRLKKLERGHRFDLTPAHDCVNQQLSAAAVRGVGSIRTRIGDALPILQYFFSMQLMFIYFLTNYQRFRRPPVG